MPASVAEFVQAAQDSGILTPEVLAEYTQDVAPETDATPLANRLVKAGRLSAFQAKYIYGGKAKSLLLGPYVVLDVLGKGGMGYVYKAEHRKMRRVVALKVIARAALKSPDAVRRFEREVQAAARLTHPNIVTAFDAGEAAGTHYLVMQYVDGRNLSEVVKELGPQPLGRAIDWILQAARGLAFAHEHGVIHRDIKPGNLLVDSRGTLQILDMGLARLETLEPDQDQLTGTGQIMGTVDYMAPEQALDTRQADARADIYSLGITLWYLLTGHPLFAGDTAMNKMMAHMHNPVPQLAGERPDVPPEVELAFQRMVAKKPADRFQSMPEVIAALESVPQGAMASGPPCIHLGDGPASIGSSGTAATQTLQRQKAAAADENTTRFSAVVVDTQTGVENNTSPTELHSFSLKPMHLALGSGAIGALVLIGVMVFAFGSNHEVKTVGRGEKTGGASAAQPTSQLDSVTGVTVAKPTAQSLTSTATGPHYALDCSEGADIPIPTLLLVANEPLTVEMTVTALQSPTQDPAQSFLFSRGPASLSLKQYRRNSRICWSWIASTPSDETPTLTTLTSGDVVIGNSYHLAGVSTGNELRLFVDGRLVARDTIKGVLPPRTFVASLVGQVSPRTQSIAFGGLITEVRISKVARYDQDYMPQARLEADGNTLGLYHFDEGTGDVLEDSSGNNHHGKITGAKWVRADGSPITSVPAALPTPPPALAPFDATQARKHQEAWAKHLGIPVETTNSIGQTFVVIPPGKFMMGEGDKTVEVTLTKPFLLGATEVTQGHWKEVMGTEPWKGQPVTTEGKDVAATNVSWDDAVSFCANLTERERVSGKISRVQEYRLPTEAEWELACRAGTATQFSFGGDDSLLGDYAWFGGGWKDEPIPGGNTASELYAHAVRLKRPNPFGLFDVHGNAWEWVADWDGDYQRTPSIDPKGPTSGAARVTRGGNWLCVAWDSRSASRSRDAPSFRLSTIGFRIALSPPQDR